MKMANLAAFSRDRSAIPERPAGGERRDARLTPTPMVSPCDGCWQAIRIPRIRPFWAADLSTLPVRH